jgi:hypothetical protein
MMADFLSSFRELEKEEGKLKLTMNELSRVVGILLL